MQDHDLLAHELALPEGHGHDHIVQWHVFRTRDAAEEYIPCIKLDDGQAIVGGHTRDSVGALYWVGVQVDNLAAWGNDTAVNKHGASP